VLEGVYRRTEGDPVFDAARAPTGDELAGLLEQIVARLMKLLTRRGYLVEEQGMTWRAETEEEKPRKALCADAHGFSLHAAVRGWRATSARDSNDCAAPSPAPHSPTNA